MISNITTIKARFHDGGDDGDDDVNGDDDS